MPEFVIDFIIDGWYFNLPYYKRNKTKNKADRDFSITKVINGNYEKEKKKRMLKHDKECTKNKIDD